VRRKIKFLYHSDSYAPHANTFTDTLTRAHTHTHTHTHLFAPCRRYSRYTFAVTRPNTRSSLSISFPSEEGVNGGGVSFVAWVTERERCCDVHYTVSKTLTVYTHFLKHTHTQTSPTSASSSTTSACDRLAARSALL
jgi:hypothetical protein